MRLKKRFVALAALVGAIGALSTVAFAQSGHFVGTPVCKDIGTQLECSGKVAGLGGTTFNITAEATAIGSVECTNPGGNVAPGQDFNLDVSAEAGPAPTPRNGQARFTLTSAAPIAPAGSCPNPGWTAEVVDVTFTSDATLTLLEDSNVSDVIVVPIDPDP
jgi:hypothetical protein